MMAEFVEGYQFLSTLQRAVTILGSARIPPEHHYYQEVERLGGILGKNKFTVVTGGGPSIMQAANKGAFEVGAESVGLNIQLPFEQVLNPYVTGSTSFSYFFTRKVMLTSPAHAFVFAPGGFGTLDEFFEVVDHIELGFMAPVPIILLGKDFWQPLIDFLKNRCCVLGTVSPEQIESWHVVDTAEEAFAIIKDIEEHPPTCDLSADNFHCYDNIDWRVFRIMAELVEGFDFMTGIKDGVTVLGTKSLTSHHAAYDAAHHLGEQLARQEVPVITGGQTGVAEAVSKGAYELGGTVLGIDLKRPRSNKKKDIEKMIQAQRYFTRKINFKFPFTRKQIVTLPSKAFVVFPGGFGTLHQLFEILTLLNTQKMERLPIVLYDRDFWQPLHEFIKKVLVHEVQTVSDQDDELYQIVDEPESIVNAINNFI
jgi:uncharacterized protein (TIGR00730 family)